jgi:hypothetical protein
MMMVVMVSMVALGVEDAISHLVHTSTEGVVVAFDGVGLSIRGHPGGFPKRGTGNGEWDGDENCLPSSS